MANEKKYASLDSLRTFKTNTDNLYATKTELEELSTNVAYINSADNENIETEEVEAIITTIDSALSETSTNPVQNKVITQEFGKLSGEIADLTTNENPEYNNIIEWGRINHKKYHEANSIEDNDGYWNTGYCAVSANTSYVCWTSSTTVAATLINFYDEDKKYISRLSGVREFTTPENCAYVVISMRYVHSGVLGTYTGIEDYDDNIGKIVVNIGTSENITAPYDDYLSEDIKIKRKVNIEGKVIYVEDGKRETATVNISRAVFSGNINICICGSNIFDGITESGYYSGSDKLADAGHKRSVNPIYVNENDYITFAKSCRVTEFDENGEYIISNLAIARIPYKTAYKTSYVHIHGLIDDMDAMYVNIGKRLTDVAETYKCTTVTEAVRDWGTTIYGVEVPLYDGTNTVFVKSLIYANISLVYNPSTDNDRSMVEDLTEKVNNINYMRGVKIANSDRFVAHRGGSDFPENTYEAYVSAFLNGFKAIESDVRFTSDNVPLMLHDATIDRTSNGTGAIANMTAEEVQSYDFGSWKHKKFTGLQIPTFKNFIRFCWQFDITPYIDMGGISATMTEEQAQILYDIVAYYGLQNKAVWCCGNFTPVEHLNKIYNATDYKLNFVYITNSETPIDSVLTSLDWFKNTSTHNLGDVSLSITYNLITDSIEKSAKEKNLKIMAYTVNDVSTAQRLSGYRIDSITTDNLDLPIAICSAIANVDFYI